MGAKKLKAAYKTRLFALLCLVIGLVILFVYSSEGVVSYHYQLRDFVAHLKKIPSSISSQHITLYGNVKEGSLYREGLKAMFILYQDKHEMPVFYTGKTLLPDSLKEGSLVAIEGHYDTDQDKIISNKITAKCASKYKTELN